MALSGFFDVASGVIYDIIDNLSGSCDVACGVNWRLWCCLWCYQASMMLPLVLSGFCDVAFSVIRLL